jgi:hypothetical protein
MLAELLVKQGLNMSNEGICEINILIRPMVDESIRQILKSSGCKFLSEHIDNITHAVWGRIANNKIARCQMEISKQVINLIEDIRGILEMASLNTSHQFALDYLIRAFIISRLLRVAAAFGIDIIEREGRQQKFSALLCIS